MNHKSTLISIVMAAIVLVSLFAVVSSAASASGITIGATGPAASTTFANGQTIIFAVDSSGALWYTPTSSVSWSSLGGVSTSSPAVTSPGAGLNVDVFVRGSDGALWLKHTTNSGSSWSNWYSLGGQLASGTGPAVASWSQGRLDVFVDGTDGALWHKWSTNGGGTWSSWESLGGSLASGPAAVSPFTVGVIDVFVRGTDGAVWQKSYDNGWSSWTSVGGLVASGTGPAVSQDLWLVVQGTDNQLWQKSVGSSGASWELPGVATVALSAASPGAVCIVTNDHTLICFSDADGNVWYGIHDSGGRIDGWTNLESPT
jgi:hypothetical protein